MKKQLAFVLALLFGIAALAGCGDKAEPSQAAPADQTAAPTTLAITFSNSTDYIFNEIYISPTAANDWGGELLGSTRILKTGGSVEIDIPAYDYENYDIRVVDEDRDEYTFTYVPLQDGSEVAISFGDGGLAADVYDRSGSAVAAISGTLNGSGGGEADTSGTGYATGGAYGFTVYNESSYDIYAIHMGPYSGASAEDVDILPHVLDAGEDTTLTGTIAEEGWDTTEWTLYITDVDGDTSQSYEVFNPWILSYVNITWDTSAGGYTYEFVYP